VTGRLRVTDRAGVAAAGWASSAAWFDYDNDGRLDLFVCRFVDFDKTKNKFCGNEKTRERYYCIPRIYDSTRCWLFHNQGDGTFTDVSEKSGIAKALGKAWGVVATDINNDGWMDLFVANDTVANFLFVNKGKGVFEETGLEAGVGYSQGGRARSGMGVDSADFDQDGWQDLFVTNVDQEMYSIYRNNHDMTFEDIGCSDCRQRRGADASEKCGRSGESLAGCETDREESEPGCDRRENHVAGWGLETQPAQDRRWKLPFFP
jgi:enediyne biosynthesis protein E4